MGFDYRTFTGLGKQTLGGHRQNFGHTRIQEKGAVTPQETDPFLPVNVQESLARGIGQQWPAPGSGVLNITVCAQDHLKEVTIIFITPTITWSQVKQQGVNTALPLNRILD